MQILRSRPVRALGIAAGVLAATVFVPGAGVAEAPGASRPQLRVALYGDSIGEEIAGPLRFLLGSADVDVLLDQNTFGGTNACDWLAEARRDARTFHPDVVITLFIGNDMTDCMHPAGRTLTDVEVARRTVADSDAIAAAFPDAVVLRVAAPRSRADQARIDAGGTSKPDLVHGLLARAATDRMVVVDGSTVLYRNGRYTDTLPCSTIDPGCTGGRVQVRAPDGVHLCPVAPTARQGVLPACEVHSPGATRLAMVIARAVTDHATA